MNEYKAKLLKDSKENGIWSVSFFVGGVLILKMMWYNLYIDYVEETSYEKDEKRKEI